MEREQRLQAVDLVLAERPQHPPGRLVAVDVPDDQLGDHRVVHRRDLRPWADAGVDADAGAARLPVGADPAGGRGEVLRRVLGVDPALDRVAPEDDVVLRVGQPVAGGDPDAGLDDVDAGRHLGHAVLDLDAGVHLEEEVLPARQQPLDRPGAPVVDRPGGVGRDRADPLAQGRVDDPRGGRRLLDQLLVAPLDRAVALAEVDHGAVAVGEDLDLDVPGIGEVAFEIDGRVAEELLALPRGPFECGFELNGRKGDPEALAAAAAGRLDGHRVADAVLRGFDDLPGGVDVFDGFGRPRDDRDTGRGHQLAGPGLRAHRVDRVG